MLINDSDQKTLPYELIKLVEQLAGPFLLNSHPSPEHILDILELEEKERPEKRNRYITLNPNEEEADLLIITEEGKKDKDFFLSLVQGCGLTLRYADKSLQKDYKIVLAAEISDLLFNES